MQKQTFRNGHTTHIEHIKPLAQQTQSFTVVYTHGFCSDPWGTKPEAVKKWCLENGIGFYRHELAGHGSDVANFEKTTINTYKDQIFEILEQIEGKVVVVGASLGGWLSLLGALQFPKKVIGFIGLAAAPDFLKAYMDMYFKPEHRELLDTVGKVEFPTGDFTYIITKQMVESAEENLLLNKESLPYDGKVCLIQGMNDKSLDWRVALRVAEKLTSSDVKTVFLKRANHRLNADEEVMELRRALDDFLIARG